MDEARLQPRDPSAEDIDFGAIQKELREFRTYLTQYDQFVGFADFDLEVLLR